MKTKTMINSVLEKKLEELESLREALTINDNDPYLHHKIEVQVTFARTLLSAEISSRLIDVEGGEQDSEETLKLRCMAKRLTELEEALNTNQFSGHDIGLFIEPETASLETSDGAVKDETSSVYSWVESCPSESDRAEEEVEENMEVTFPSVEEELKEKEGRVGRKAFICSGLIGLVGVIMSLVGYFGDHMKEDNLFLVPT